MPKLLQTSQFTSNPLRTFSSVLSKPLQFHMHLTPSLSPLHRFSLYNSLSKSQSPHTSCQPRRNFSIRAFDAETKSDDVSSEKEEKPESRSEVDDNNGSLKGAAQDYPSGEFEFESPGLWKSFLVKIRMLIALPWQRVRKGSVLNIKLRGQVRFCTLQYCFYFSTID